ncbi:MAG TPA: DUF2171 domain-containing protein [Sphingomicrobium sp.]|nr:DUF2171 domain-containing protein [Sphingomicrobium sp.]
MAYDRYDTRRGSPEQSRHSDDRFRDRDREGREGRERGSRDERGFFERAGEQISSWFGDDEDDRHGRQLGRQGDRMGGFDRDPGRGFGQDQDRARERSSRSDRPDSNWDRDQYRRTSFAGSSERSQHDPHYQQWRQRQIEELDRDYEEYRREHQSKFENDFGSWRSSRQTKRQMLGQIREHMDVVGKDEEHVGKVDRVAGDRIILTKSDPESGGVHHSLSCSEIDCIEGDRVVLGINAAEARNRWRDENRERALFEREDQGEAGPHMLDRSFSGTYR